MTNDTTRSPYDLLTRFAGNGIAVNNGSLNIVQFVGAEAIMMNNGPIKVTFLEQGDRKSSQNFSHIGDFTDAENYRVTLMNGCSVPTNGNKLKMTPFDLAMLVDIGYPIRSVFFRTRVTW